MINVLHTIDTTGPGGAEKVFLTLAQGLDPDRFRSYVAIAGRGWLHDQLLDLGIAPVIVGGKRGFDLSYLKNLIDLIRINHIDVVQSHLFGSNVYSCLAGALSRVPVICTFHGSVDIGQRSLLRAIKLLIVKYCATRVVSVSRTLETEIRGVAKIVEDKSVVIFNGVDTSVFYKNRNDFIRKQLGISESAVLIGAIGNIRAAKNYRGLLLAAAELRKASKEFKVVIIGEGHGVLYQELLDLRHRLGLENTVYFLGYQDDVSKLLNSLDIYVLSSKSEGFSISTIEAMACELPVIATRCGGPEEIIQDNVNGLLVDVDDAKQLAVMIRHVAEDRSLRNRLPQQARLGATTKFSTNAMVHSYQMLYEKYVRINT